MDSLDRSIVADLEENDERLDLAERGQHADTTFETIMAANLDRRAVLKGTSVIASAAPFMAVPSLLPGAGEAQAQVAGAPTGAITFTSVPENQNDALTVPPEYRSNIVIRWGDPLVPGLGPLDLNNQTPAGQAQRFGFNNDMVALFPERMGAPATVGRLPYPSYIMCVNHEYTTGPNMFPGYVAGSPTENQVLVEIEAHGISVVQVRLVNGEWRYEQASRFNRRITGSTPIDITGPAAGHTLLRTPADPTGTRVLGTLNNCAGGFTPWGTYLSSEENFQQYFANRGQLTQTAPNTELDHRDQGVPSGASGRRWENFVPRFNVAVPEGRNEPYRFGWNVEVDPYDPTSTPKKRTAMGRFRHECATCALTADNRVAVYSGDDAGYEYVYKFVSRDAYNPNDRAAALNLLDTGTLYVARFDANGTGRWLPLDFAAPEFQAALTAANGRPSTSEPATGGASNVYADGTRRIVDQATLLIHTRRAADIVGATPMDRPEDVEATVDANFRGDGRVYVVLTQNAGGNRITGSGSLATRGTAGRGTSRTVDASNPRPNNEPGHIIEILEDGRDNAALTFTWRVFMLCGDPANPAVPDPGNGAVQNTNVVNPLTGTATLTGDRFARPDNIAFDRFGNIYISTDGNDGTFTCGDVVMVAPTNVADGAAVPVKHFLVCPPGSEACGPLLSPDNTSFFIAVQHPGEGGDLLGSGQISAWPNGDFARPSVAAVRRIDGGRIGS